MQDNRLDSKTLLLVLLVLVASAAGCAARLPIASPPPGGGAYPTSAGPEARAAVDVSADSSAEMAPSAAAARPGLGTEWGETRTSTVTHTAFERASSSPTALGAFYYNDREGAEAMASRDDFRRLAESVFRLPNLPVTVSIRGDGGALPAVSSGSRCYAVGEPGARYTIQIENQSGLRLEVVASVDGLDVIDGKQAGYHKRGYLIRPFGSITIDGWRQSDATVAAFRFGSVRDSYAARTGSDRNVGVIGVAFFHERGAQPPGYWTDEEIRKRQTADPFPSRYATPPPARID